MKLKYQKLLKGKVLNVLRIWIIRSLKENSKKKFFHKYMCFKILGYKTTEKL